MISIRVHASTDEKFELPDQTYTMFQTLNPSEAFARAQSIFRYYQIPAEPDPNPHFQKLGERYSVADFQARLKWMDPSSTFLRFLQFGKSFLQVYQDMTSNQIEDFNFDFQQPADRGGLRDRILMAQKNPKAQQLRGLRIALDPGHMGGRTWDKISGKYVSDGKRWVSEGDINLAVCLLLKKDLENLGAQVLITHTNFAPVSRLNYQTFNIRPWAQQELRYLSLEPWFQALLTAAPAGPSLNAAFDQSANVQKLFSESSRWQYFNKRADLDARVDMMQAFNPDITIYVHHDTAGDAGVSPNSPNKTRAFVPGSFGPTELANRASRKYITRHLLDKEAWELSVHMIRTTLKQINKRMGIPTAKTDGSESTKVEDGIFARNLVVPRKMHNTVTAYWEMFFYDRTDEFNALLNHKYTMVIDGKNFPYSERLRQSVESLREGLVDFVRTAN